MAKSLDQIALGLPLVTDKASSGHGYLEHYAAHFQPFRNKPIKLCEIGCFEGASMALWLAYFPLAQIIGCDIDITQCQVQDARLRLWEMDQRYEVSIENMAHHLGPFDIVIDDGSHHPTDSIRAFECLWKVVNPGGLYCIEDLQTSYKPFNDVHPNMVEYIGGPLSDDLHARGKTITANPANSPQLEQDLLMGREREIASIHLYRYLAIIQRN